METIEQLSFFWRFYLYTNLTFIAVFSLIIFYWQIEVIKGNAMKNADGSVDNWREQKILYGMAVSDVVISCPLNLLGIVLIYIQARWGFYLLALVSFWWVWANSMTTITSLKFERPKITLYWFVTFPLGILIGLAYMVFTIVNFDLIYGI